MIHIRGKGTKTSIKFFVLLLRDIIRIGSNRCPAMVGRRRLFLVRWPIKTRIAPRRTRSLDVRTTGVEAVATRIVMAKMPLSAATPTIATASCIAATSIGTANGRIVFTERIFAGGTAFRIAHCLFTGRSRVGAGFLIGATFFTITAVAAVDLSSPASGSGVDITATIIRSRVRSIFLGTGLPMGTRLFADFSCNSPSIGGVAI
mmetsp:Transcript_27558/g.57956  ORF Transcript_27558/g.57956 Transcript_27558/m.57956 type:complete len:204 (+) Transcript_27558:978-1589(+)